MANLDFCGPIFFGPDFFDQVFACLTETDIAKKCRLTEQLHQLYNSPEKLAGTDLSKPAIEDSGLVPGCPAKPELVAPGNVKRRGLGSEKGRAAFVHAIAHIEFNAINLALDALWRFRAMPPRYYTDWLLVASEEAYHFGLLENRLKELGHAYGDFPSHNSLWDMAEETAHDVMVRMALVPRVLEARGLDITPFMIKKLSGTGDMETVRLLKIILEDEIGHVAIGSRWFHHCCTGRGLEPVPTFLTLVKKHMTSPPKSPFNDKARQQAGFSEQEILELLEMEKKWLKEIKKQSK